MQHSNNNLSSTPMVQIKKETEILGDMLIETMPVENSRMLKPYTVCSEILITLYDRIVENKWQDQAGGK